MVWENKNVTTHMWVESQSAFDFLSKVLYQKTIIQSMNRIWWAHWAH